jgi:predicted transcriptional regulator
MTEDDTQPMTIRLPKPTHERLRRLAFEARTPMNQIAVAAIESAVAIMETEKETRHANASDR